MTDNVHRPSHYTRTEMEPVQVIEGLGLDFHQGQILKYIYRHRYKHLDPILQREDLQKARFYLDRLIQQADKRIEKARNTEEL